MNFTKLLGVLPALIFACGELASAAEPKALNPQGVIFTAEQIKGQKFVAAPGPYWTPTEKQVKEKKGSRLHFSKNEKSRRDP